jgi:glucosamine--fructose-6-phosphate aminotransferase (isomerizing)
MLREGPRVPADANETGDWLHVDVYLSRHPGYRALLFPGSRFDAGVMAWARERASTIVAVGAPVDGAAMHIPFPHASDPLVASLVETTVAEVVAAEMWRRQAPAH